MRNKLIVLDGIDRSGKGTAIDLLVDNKELNEKYKIITINHRNNNIHFDKFFKVAGNELTFDHIGSTNIYWMFMMIKKLLENNKSKRPLLILMDRFYVSGYVNGKVLRKESFESIWKFDEYELYTQAFLKEINDIGFDLKYFIITKSPNYEFEDDNDNKLIKIPKEKLNELNNLYKKLAFYNKDNKSYINYELKSSDVNELYFKIIEELGTF